MEPSENIQKDSIPEEFEKIISEFTFAFLEVCPEYNNNNLITYGNYGGAWVSFGEDTTGELYIVDISGSIYKVKGGEIFDTQSFSKSQVSLTPNPASSSIRILLNGHLMSKIDIIDIKGAIVYTEENLSLSEKNISLESIKSGIYIVKVLSDNGQSIFKKLIIN